MGSEGDEVEAIIFTSLGWGSRFFGWNGAGKGRPFISVGIFSPMDGSDNYRCYHGPNRKKGFQSMTLPWWLNPWAEVQKWRRSAYYLGRLAESLTVENAELKRQISGLQFQALAQQREMDFIRRTAG